MWWPWWSPCTDGSTRTATARRSVNSSRTVYNILQHPAVESYSWRIGWLRPTRWSLVMLLGQVVCKCSYQWVYSSATLISKLTSCVVDKYTRVNGTERRSPSRCSKHKQGSCRVLRSVILSAFRWNLFFFWLCDLKSVRNEIKVCKSLLNFCLVWPLFSRSGPRCATLTSFVSACVTLPCTFAEADYCRISRRQRDGRKAIHCNAIPQERKRCRLHF